VQAKAGAGGSLDHDSPKSPESRFIGGLIQENKDKCAKANPITYVSKDVPPFLIMHGTSDPTVAFTNGLAMYNALRYNGKKAVLLAYEGEGHGLRGVANRKDLTIRYFQFFDHYLKDAPAPKWMTEGMTWAERKTLLEPGKQDVVRPIP